MGNWEKNGKYLERACYCATRTTTNINCVECRGLRIVRRDIAVQVMVDNVLKEYDTYENKSEFLIVIYGLYQKHRLEVHYSEYYVEICGFFVGRWEITLEVLRSLVETSQANKIT